MVDRDLDFRVVGQERRSLQEASSRLFFSLLRTFTRAGRRGQSPAENLDCWTETLRIGKCDGVGVQPKDEAGNALPCWAEKPAAEPR